MTIMTPAELLFMGFMVFAFGAQGRSRTKAFILIWFAIALSLLWK